jgi:hypothetical protein
MFNDYHETVMRAWGASWIENIARRMGGIFATIVLAVVTLNTMELSQLEQLPFLASLCWQGTQPTIAHLSELDILHLYERNWRLRGVMADLSEPEVMFIRRIAAEYHSWLVNEV